MTAGANGVERPIRVMLAVHDPGVLAALTDLIDDEHGMTVVGAARDANEAVLVGHRVRAPGSGRVLQLWLMRVGVPTSVP